MIESIPVTFELCNHSHGNCHRMAASELGCGIILVGTFQEETKLKTSACKTTEQKIVLRMEGGILKEEFTPLYKRRCSDQELVSKCYANLQIFLFILCDVLHLKSTPFFGEEKKRNFVVCWHSCFFDQVTNCFVTLSSFCAMTGYLQGSCIHRRPSTSGQGRVA